MTDTQGPARDLVRAAAAELMRYGVAEPELRDIAELALQLALDDGHLLPLPVLAAARRGFREIARDVRRFDQRPQRSNCP